MKWISKVTEETPLEPAVQDVATAVDAELGAESPDLVFVFASPHFSEEYAEVPGALQGRFPGALVIGCSAGGVVGDGREVERRPALSVTAAVLPDVELRPFHVGSGEARAMLQRPKLWPELLEVEEGDEPDIVLFPDPFTCNAEALVQSLDLAFPDGGKVGGMASGGRSVGDNALFLDDRVHPSGAVGVALRGAVTLDTIVAQGCRPIGSPVFVTRAEGNRILEIDGRPPTDVLRDLYASLPERDQELFRSSLFVGLVMEEGLDEYRQGDFLIRNIVGLDADEGTISIGTSISPGQVVQFHLRDARTSARDLDEMLHRYREERGEGAPAGALLFSCMGRGEHLYDEPDHDSRMIADVLGQLPIGGFFCNGEIGPVRGRSFLHGYTSSIALFLPEPASIDG